MSSTRRNPNEVNILAMLDRDAGNPLGRRFPRLPVVAAYGGGLLLVCGLVGMLAWLVDDSSDGSSTEAHLAEAIKPPLAMPAAPGSNPPLTVPPGMDLEPTRGATGATVVNLAATPVPPRLPAPLPAAPAPAVPVPSAAIRVPVPVRAQEATRVAAREQEARPVRAATARPALRTPGAAKPAPAPAVAHADLPGRSRRGAAATKQGPAQPVDTDVALISAIIQHSSTRKEGQDEPACADKACAGRPAVRP